VFDRELSAQAAFRRQPGNRRAQLGDTGALAGRSCQHAGESRRAAVSYRVPASRHFHIFGQLTAN